MNVCDSRIVRLFLFILFVQVAKWSGDLFNEGLYDIHIKLKRVPLLEWAIPQEMYRCVLKSYSSSLHWEIYVRLTVKFNISENTLPLGFALSPEVTNKNCCLLIPC